jgi:multiple sugar transport system substrate-binding protein
MKKKGLFFLMSVVTIVNFAVMQLNLLDPSPEGSAYEEGVLRVWVSWGDNPDHLQPLFDRYTVETGQPVRVTTGVDIDQIDQALTSETPPDVVVLSNSAPVGSYYEDGTIESLDTWIETTGIALDDIFPASLVQCEMPDGSIPCLPWVSDAFALFWNKDAFVNAGLDPERPPQTLEELLEYADLLTIRNVEGELSQVGFIPDYPRSHTDLYAHMFGGSWFHEKGTELAVNSQEMIDASNWQLMFFQAPGIEETNQFVSSINRYMNSSHPVFGNTTLNCQQCHRYVPAKNKNMPDQGFYDGKVAMMVDGEWQLGAEYISQLSPGLNYGVAPLPPSAGHPERANSTVVQGAVAVIPSGALDKKAAANLMAWMMSPETAAEVAIATTSLPTNRVAANDLRFKRIPNFQVFMDLMAAHKSSSVVSTPISLEVNEALAEVEKGLLHNTGGLPTNMLVHAQADLSTGSRRYCCETIRNYAIATRQFASAVTKGLHP